MLGDYGQKGFPIIPSIRTLERVIARASGTVQELELWRTQQLWLDSDKQEGTEGGQTSWL